MCRFLPKESFALFSSLKSLCVILNLSSLIFSSFNLIALPLMWRHASPFDPARPAFVMAFKIGRPSWISSDVILI